MLPYSADEIQMFSQKSGVGRSSSFIGHMLEFEALAPGENIYGKVPGGIHSRSSVGKAGVGLGISDELIDGLER
jgi:hypothetical protein